MGTGRMSHPLWRLLCGWWCLGVLLAFQASRQRPSRVLGPNTCTARSALTWNSVMERIVNQTFGATKEAAASPVDPHQILMDTVLGTTSTPSQTVAAYESVTRYLQLWARQLEQDNELATPVVASDFRNVTPPLLRGKAGEELFSVNKDSSLEQWLLGDADSLDSGESSYSLLEAVPHPISMKLKFRPPERYLSYKEQKNMEKGVLPDRKGAKVDTWSPGGVSLTVFCVKTQQQEELRLLVRRCDIDGDTIIKFNSERAIVRRLEAAIRIWKRVRAMS